MSEHDAEVKRLEGMTMIGEDTEIRPAAMSHVKPSEFRYYALRALRHAAEDVATARADAMREVREGVLQLHGDLTQDGRMVHLPDVLALLDAARER